jgi:pSer/pThr/pTyr-binding forkhead associated (FHA) protein
MSTAVLKRNTPVPTHIVYRGVAYPVNGAGLVIGRSRIDERTAILVDDEVKGVSRSHCEISLVDGELRLRDVSSHGTFVNERRIDGDEVLRPADVIRVGTPGAELTAVVVGDNNGS